MTSNFFFSHSVFKKLVLQTCKNKGLLGKGLSTSRTYWFCSLMLHTCKRRGWLILYHTIKFNIFKFRAFADNKSEVDQMMKLALN